MRRAGGGADVDSAPGAGTRIRLSWPTTPSPAEPSSPPNDPDRLIQRSRVRYRLALTGYAGANLIIMAPYAVTHGDHPAAQIVLAGVALLGTMSAVPVVRTS